jgi:hypothetical protein
MINTKGDLNMTKDQIRQEILITIKANNIYISGDVYFALVFRTKQELIKIAQEMNIKIN